MGAAHLLLQQKKGNVKYKLGNINQSLAPLALHIFVLFWLGTKSVSGNRPSSTKTCYTPKSANSSLLHAIYLADMKASFSENSYTTSRGLRSFRRLLFPVWTPNFEVLILGTLLFPHSFLVRKHRGSKKGRCQRRCGQTKPVSWWW